MTSPPDGSPAAEPVGGPDPAAGAAPGLDPAAGAGPAPGAAAAPRAGSRLDGRRLVAVTLLLTSFAVLLGYLLKAQCKADYNADRDRLLCSNDIQVLYWARGLAEKQFPYVQGGLEADGSISGGTVEYPVLTGIAAWLPSLVVDDAGAYLTATAVLLAPFALLTALLLLRMARWRALVFAAGPPLVWYSFHNWDLLVVCATVAAFYAWSRGRTGWAAVLLAVGAALKLWPGFFLLPLLLDRLIAKDAAGARRVVLGGVVTTAALNAPFLLVNPSGWWAPYAFQERRAADITSNSIWFWGFGDALTTEQLNRLIPVLLLWALAAACTYGWWRGRDEGAFPLLQVCAAVLCAFLLLNKAHSPQFALWLLPFFVLVRLHWGWVVAYLAVDTMFYIGLFRWFYDLGRGADALTSLPRQAVVLGVWGRVVLLVVLFVLFLRARAAVAGPQRPPDRGTGAPFGRTLAGPLASSRVRTATAAASPPPV